MSSSSTVSGASVLSARNVKGFVKALGWSMGTVRRLMEHHDQSRGLDDLRQTPKIEERDADRQAAREWTVLPEILDPLLAQGLGPGLNVLGLQVEGDIVVVPIIAGPPGTPNA